jgi:integrase
MSRSRTGSVEKRRRKNGTTYYRARIRLADGSRVRVDVPKKYATDDDAEVYALAVQEREDERGELLAAKKKREEERATDTSHGETCEAYFGRHTKAREAEGVRDVRKERTIWGKWLSPRIGPRPVAAVTRDEIESIRDVLDEQVRERIKGGLGKGISGDTAQNVWSVLRTMFKEAVGSRDRTRRVRIDDPTAGHKPPLKTPSRKKTFIHPREMAQLLGCRDVPRAWREAYAVATYTYVRPEELQALTWRDVDFAADTISVSKAIDARTGKAKPLPKTQGAVREVPIDPALMPLLKRMHDEAPQTDDGVACGPVLPVLAELNDKFRAKQLRAHLRLADVTRERLFAETPTLLPVNFRSCRDSGITWLALAGVPLQVMKGRAGHEEVETTLGYVKMAEDLGGRVGKPFPPLPAELLGQASGQVARTLRKTGPTWVPEEGIERTSQTRTRARKLRRIVCLRSRSNRPGSRPFRDQRPVRSRPNPGRNRPTPSSNAPSSTP